MTSPLPGLFGIQNSNRDFSQPESWGKNQFNNSFPIALACYMNDQGLEPVYIQLNSSATVTHGKINVADVFGIAPEAKHLFFAFESDYVPYRLKVIGKMPRVDVVTIDSFQANRCLKALEIKLTALPDHSTYRLNDHLYGCEIVTRPDTIVYLALSIAENFAQSRTEILNYLEPVCSQIKDWSTIKSVQPFRMNLIQLLDALLLDFLTVQKPLVLQPIWKTIGKTAKLYEHCLDIFVWSDFAFTRLFVDMAKNSTHPGEESIQRPMRSVIWLIKMLYDFARTGKINHRQVIDHLTYNTRNDKAFALNGLGTRPYMNSPELICPRVTKSEIRQIILGGGQNLLSPERRFDAIILSNPEIFLDLPVE